MSGWFGTSGATGLTSQLKVLPSLGLIALYVLLAGLFAVPLAGTFQVDFLWLTGGIALTVVLLGGYRFMPALFLGALCGSLVAGDGVATSVLNAVSHVFSVALGIWLLKRREGFDPKLLKLPDFAHILLLAFWVGLVSASSKALQLWLFPSLVDPHGFNQNLSGQLLGVVIIMPFLLVWQSLPYGWPSLRKGAEAGMIIVLSFLVGQVVFHDWFQTSLGQIARGYWLYLFITWAAARLGLHGTVTILAMIAIQGLLGALMHTGFFATDIEKTNLANYFFYMLILATVGMALATYLIERSMSLVALKQSRDHLERKVASRTEDLAQQLNKMVALNEQLQRTQSQLLQSEKMASLGQLAAGVAHEINNPVGFINSNLGTLKNYLHDIFALLAAYEATTARLGTPEELAELVALKKEKELDYIESDTVDLLNESAQGLERVKKIVMDLKGFSHLSQNVFEMGDIHECLESTLNIVWHELKYKCKVTKYYDAALPKILCIPSQLSQVFMNLLVNAAQAIQTQGEIEITTRFLAPDTVQVTIRDNGSGIPPENIKNIFDPFFTTKPVGKGTGLGLSLAYGIVVSHHGTIDVESVVGKGTVFTLMFPLGVEEAKSAAG